MPRSLRSPRHEALRAFLVERRKAAGLTQAVLAERLRIHRSYVADIERGQRRVDVVELFALAEAIGFDPGEAIERMKG
jgi:transcriptional regulator with XRE-family HTH domain